MDESQNNLAFVKLSRKILEWEWYKDTNTKALFLHCLLKANWKAGRFKGVDVPRGSFVSSYPVLAQELNLSVRSVRTCIEHLKSTGELTVKSHPKFSVFTVKNYDLYQASDRQSDRQPTGNRQATDNNRRNKEIKNKRSNIHRFGDFEQSDYDFDLETLREN